ARVPTSWPLPPLPCPAPLPRVGVRPPRSRPRPGPAPLPTTPSRPVLRPPLSATTAPFTHHPGVLPPGTRSHPKIPSPGPTAGALAHRCSSSTALSDTVGGVEEPRHRKRTGVDHFGRAVPQIAGSASAGNHPFGAPGSFCRGHGRFPKRIPPVVRAGLRKTPRRRNHRIDHGLVADLRLPQALNGVGRNTEGRGQVRDRPRGFGAVSHPPEPQTEQRATGPTGCKEGVGNRLEHLRGVVRADLRKAGAHSPQGSVEIPTEITVTGTPIQVGQLTGPIGDPVGEGDDPCPCLLTGQPFPTGTALRAAVDVGHCALLSFASRHQCSAGVRTGASQSSTSSSVTAVSVIEKPFMSSEVT